MVRRLARANVGWLVALCSAELGTMLLFSSFSAVIPVLPAEWRLSNVEVGFILGAYQVGYTLAVVVLATLTDWISARRIYIGSALWAAGAGAGFALVSDDVVAGLVWRTLAGVGLAGTYMPGLRLVTERFGGKHRGFAIGSYSSRPRSSCCRWWGGRRRVKAPGRRTVERSGECWATAPPCDLSALTGRIPGN